MFRELNRGGSGGISGKPQTPPSSPKRELARFDDLDDLDVQSLEGNSLPSSPESNNGSPPPPSIMGALRVSPVSTPRASNGKKPVPVVSGPVAAANSASSPGGRAATGNNTNAPQTLLQPLEHSPQAPAYTPVKVVENVNTAPSNAPWTASSPRIVADPLSTLLLTPKSAGSTTGSRNHQNEASSLAPTASAFAHAFTHSSPPVARFNRQ